jgi:cell wall-associated NlpC family hydrolase
MNEYVGIPYRELDCYALVRKVSKQEYSVVLPVVADYANDPAAAVERWESCLNWKSIPQPEVGCVVVMGQSIGCAKHVGIYIGGAILHSTRKYGSVIQDMHQVAASGYTHLRYYRWRLDV